MFFEEGKVSIISSCSFPQFDKKMPEASNDISINLAPNLSILYVCFKVKNND